MHPVEETMTVLDVGCGTGSHLEAYADAGAACWGVDLSAAMLEIARERLGASVDLTLADATDLPFDDDRFDLVFASLFLHELDPATRRGVLDEMARVVRPTGRVLVIDYRSGPMRWKGRAWRMFSTVAERIAGRRHYEAWRTYLAGGGFSEILPQGLDVERERPVAGGNLALWLLRRTDMGSQTDA